MILIPSLLCSAISRRDRNGPMSIWTRFVTNCIGRSAGMAPHEGETWPFAQDVSSRRRLRHSAHPYTEALMKAAPELDPTRRSVIDAVRGELPSPARAAGGLPGPCALPLGDGSERHRAADPQGARRASPRRLQGAALTPEMVAGSPQHLVTAARSVSQGACWDVRLLSGRLVTPRITQTGNRAV
jgi:Oligopeptide/dipeptide transporter, C-terminal region